MILTPAIISASTGAPLPRASDWLPAMQTACDRFGIDTPLRVAAFLSQCGHESAGLARTAESFDYSIAALPGTFHRITPYLAKTLGRQPGERMVPVQRQQRIANIAYAGRYGNGDSASGDGWAFRGSGLIQLTFRGNFEECGTDLSLDLAGEPDRVRTDPALAALVSAWFCSSKGLNVLADTGNLAAITKRINPAMLGALARLPARPPRSNPPAASAAITPKEHHEKAHAARGRDCRVYPHRADRLQAPRSRTSLSWRRRPKRKSARHVPLCSRRC